MSAPRSLPRHLEPYLDTVVGPRMFNTIRTVNGVITSRHKGIDFACPTGIPLEAGMDGTISLVGGSMTHQWGYYVHVICLCPLNHVQEFHILRDKPTFYIGQRIKAGQHIGFTGRSGSLGGISYFPHHHHGTSVNGVYFDPLRIGWPSTADDGSTPIDNTEEDVMTPEQEARLTAKLDNLIAYVYNGGPDVPGSPGGKGSVLQRIIDVQNALTVSLPKVDNINRQVTGADGFMNSVAERVIRIEAGMGGEAPVVDIDALAAAIAAKLPAASGGLTKQDVIDAITSVTYRAE